MTAQIPPLPHHVVFIGAGGFGKGVAAMAYHEDVAYGKAWDIKGFLDDRTTLQGTTAWPILGSVDSYHPAEGDYFVCALGDPAMRRRYTLPLLEKGAEFMLLCPRLRTASPISAIGRGALFELDVSIGAETTLGEFVTILSMSIIGHDVTIGNYVQIGNFVFVGGGARIADDVTIHTHATISPGVSIGQGAIVGAGSVVLKDVPAGATVFGNPARMIFSK